VTVPPQDRSSDRSSDRSGNQTNDRAHDERMTELRQLFFETAAELVQKLNEEAMQLEQSPSDAEAARSLRRTVHTLKGDAAACGFREFSELCHEFEDVLALENPATAASVPAIALRAADVFAGHAGGLPERHGTPSIESLRAEIAHLAHPADSGAAKSKKQGPETLGEESTLVGV